MGNSGARPWAVGDWLQGLGLGRYEADFRENAIDADILRDLTDQDLEKLGVVLGDRRRLLRAIAVLDDAPSPAKLASGPLPVTFAPASGAVTPPISAAIEVSGEGRHVTVMFCGLVDSTGIVGKLDAEEWCGLVGAYFEAASLGVGESYAVAAGRPHLVTNAGDTSMTILVLQGVGEYDYVPLV